MKVVLTSRAVQSTGHSSPRSLTPAGFGQICNSRSRGLVRRGVRNAGGRVAGREKSLQASCRARLRDYEIARRPYRHVSPRAQPHRAILP